MAARLTVDFNGGSNGATITAAGAIAAVTGAPIYTTAAAVHGALGMGVTPATNASTFIRVDVGANPVSHSFSIYWHPKSQSASTTTLIRFADASNANIFSIVQSTTKLVVVDSTSTAQATSSTTWGDQVYRIDGQVDFSTNTAPVVTLRLFAVPEGTVPTETLTPTLTNPGNLTFSRWLIGAVGTGGSGSTRSVLFDTFRVADGAEWLGPFQTSTTHVLTASGTAASDGSAALSLRAALSATGSAASGGSAALTARQALTAAGSVASDGSAALGIAHPLTAAGTAAAGGSAPLNQRLALVAAGTAQADGHADLELKAGPVNHQLTASGAGTAGGSAVLTAELSLQAAGLASAGGAANLTATLALTAAGTATGSGHADLQIYSRITKRPAEGTTRRPTSVLIPRPNAGITTRP